MFRVNEVPVSIEENNDKQNLKQVLTRYFNIDESKIKKYRIVKRSLDARKKSNIHYKYNFDVEFEKDINSNIIQQFKLQEVKHKEIKHCYVNKIKTVMVVGSGPSGLFSALELARAGVKVILLERGERVEDRLKTVESFLSGGKFNAESNIQFGEGGAGTFSDGKLNTGINSPLVEEVLDTFYIFGATEDILYDSKPHIGTDYLRKIVSSIRNEIINLGGEVHFNSKFTDFEIVNDKLKVFFTEETKKQVIVDDLVLALGYSARDTLRHLCNQKGIEFKQKAFSVGYRIEHLQENINKAQYGDNYNKLLPPADYKLFEHLQNGRTVYTFCMCPGGEVVPAMSNNFQIVTNGMSYHSRSGKNANSAILVSVDEKDYNGSHPLSGMDYQEKLEKLAYNYSNGKFVVSRVEDFFNNKTTRSLGVVKPTIKPNFVLGDVSKLLPKELACSIKEGLKAFGKKLKGFDDKDAILTGIETRSSAPFMIVRKENLSTSVEHVYAVGEGAGMAGGIVSSAVDGLKIARKIIENYLKEK